MPRPVSALLALLGFALAGCAAPATEPEDGPADVWSVDLACGGGAGAVRAFEWSYLESCWAHVGHHLYFLDVPVAVVAGEGALFAVEATAAGAPEGAQITLDASLDGRTWTVLNRVAYPGGGDDRHDVKVSFEVPGGAPARFVRIWMPPSPSEGLAGYLDASRLTLTVRSLDPAPSESASTRQLDCATTLLESFFPDHPCWFGGYDAADAALGPEPVQGHIAGVEGSYYDSPSFLHTHYVGAPVRGAFEATVRVQHWRTLLHFPRCSAEDPLEAPVQPTVVAQASLNGTAWMEVGRATGDYDGPITIRGTLAEDARFVRFAATPTPGSRTVDPCHHPTSFFLESRATIS